MIQFKILDIQKVSHQSESFNWSNNILLYIIGYISVVFLGVGIIMIAISYVSKRKVRKRLIPIVESNTKTRKIKLMKYGFMILLMLGIIGITLTIINAYTPFYFIYLASKYNPFVYPVLAILFILIISVFVPIYLFLFKTINEYKQKNRSKPKYIS